MLNERIYKLISMLLDEHLTGHEIMAELQISRNQFHRVKDRMRQLGVGLIYDPSIRTYSLKNNAALTDSEALVVSRLQHLDLGRRQLDGILKALSYKQQPVEQVELSFTKDKFVFGLISDLHIGSKWYRPDILRHAAENFKRLNVDFILNIGDTVEGMSNRPGHVFEVDPIKGLGITKQADYMAEEFKQFGDLNVYSIEAQGSHGGWAYKMGNTGLEIGQYLALMSMCKLDEDGNISAKIREGGGQYKFVGYDVKDFVVDGIVIRMRHPEKTGLIAFINSIMPGNKPHLMIHGHFHSEVGYRPHRNVHAIDAACMQTQTPFLGRLGSTPILGYWIVEVEVGNCPSETGQGLQRNGVYVESLNARFVQFYD
jgi:hypothetical protein